MLLRLTVDKLSIPNARIDNSTIKSTVATRAKPDFGFLELGFILTEEEVRWSDRKIWVFTFEIQI